LILVGIYTNSEKKPEMALEIVKNLRAEYPQSPFMHELEILILGECHRGDEMKNSAEDYIAKCRSGEGYYTPRSLTKGYDHLAAAEALLGMWDKVVEADTHALDGARSTDPYSTAAHLHRGEAYDVLGHRDQAVAEYRLTLRGPDLWEFKSDAEHYLKTPYQAATAAKTLVPSLENQP
jgi:hypothetical protein